MINIDIYKLPILLRVLVYPFFAVILLVFLILHIFYVITIDIFRRSAKKRTNKVFRDTIANEIYSILISLGFVKIRSENLHIDFQMVRIDGGYDLISFQFDKYWFPYVRICFGKIDKNDLEHILKKYRVRSEDVSTRYLDDRILIKSKKNNFSMYGDKSWHGISISVNDGKVIRQSKDICSYIKYSLEEIKLYFQTGSLDDKKFLIQRSGVAINRK
ncbi:MAG: hypothetical protein NTV72_00140 [Candidatus Taylorbacteria bacterium]|nr:hypothetical protein [Candidatus Taylorbacteria bacterium]